MLDSSCQIFIGEADQHNALVNLTDGKRFILRQLGHDGGCLLAVGVADEDLIAVGDALAGDDEVGSRAEALACHLFERVGNGDHRHGGGHIALVGSDDVVKGRVAVHKLAPAGLGVGLCRARGRLGGGVGIGALARFRGSLAAAGKEHGQQKGAEGEQDQSFFVHVWTLSIMFFAVRVTENLTRNRWRVAASAR